MEYFRLLSNMKYVIYGDRKGTICSTLMEAKQIAKLVYLEIFYKFKTNEEFNSDIIKINNLLSINHKNHLAFNKQYYEMFYYCDQRAGPIRILTPFNQADYENRITKLFNENMMKEIIE